MSLELRAGELGDLAELERQAADFFRGGLVPIGTDAGRKSYLERTFREGFVILAETAGRYRGSLGLMRLAWEHGGGEYLADRWWHGLDGRAALALHAAARQVASRLRLPLWCGQATGYQAPAVARLMARLGGELAGSTFRFD